MNLEKTKFLLIVLAIFTLLTLLLFWPIFLGKVNLNAHLLVSFYPIFGENLPYKNIVGLDQIRLYFPNYPLIISQLKNFEFPLWNPHIFSGNLNIASLQSAVFYPLNIFSFVLPQIEFWHLLRLSPPILASFFTFIYLRGLKLSKLASFFGALTFGFSPFILAWGEEQVNTPHTVIWLPLVLFCIDKLASRGKFALKNRIFFSLVALSVAFSVFAGFIQTTIYLVIFAVFYAIFRLGFKKENISRYFLIFGAIGFGILISFVQLLPTAELYFNSARASVAVSEGLFKFLLPLESLFTYLSPDYFGNPVTWNFFREGIATYYESIMFVGVGALLFAVYEIFENKDDKFSRFLFIFGAVALSLTLDFPSSKLFLSLPIPFLSSSIANRLLFIPTFCFAVLASFGFDKWLFSKDKKIVKYIVVLVAAYALSIVFAYVVDVEFGKFQEFGLGIFIRLDTFKVSLRNLVIPIFIFVVSSFLIYLTTFWFKSKKQHAAFFLIILAFGHLFLFGQKYMSFSSRKYVFPSTPVLDFIQKEQGVYRSWGLGEAYLENNFPSFYRIFWAEGYNSLNILSYAQFTNAMQGGDVDNFIFRADAGLGRGKSSELLAKAERRRLIDLVGVKFVIGESTDFELLEKNNFKKVFEDSKNIEGKTFGVFENKDVLPRVFLASNWEGPPHLESSGQAPVEMDDSREKEIARRRLIPQKLLASDFDYRNVVVLEKPSPISPQFGDGSAEIVKYQPQEVVIKTNSDQPKILFLSDNYYPGWKAKVDGDNVEILRANYTFRAVPLTPGEHEVRFYFDSDSFELGLAISLVSLGMLLVFTLVQTRLLKLP